MHFRVLGKAQGALRSLSSRRAGQWVGAGHMSIRFMSVMVNKGGLKVDMKLVRLVENDISPARGSTPSSFGAPLGGSS